jgi:hypothetical protein
MGEREEERRAGGWALIDDAASSARTSSELYISRVMNQPLQMEISIFQYGKSKLFRSKIRGWDSQV